MPRIPREDIPGDVRNPGGLNEAFVQYVKGAGVAGDYLANFRRKFNATPWTLWGVTESGDSFITERVTADQAHLSVRNEFQLSFWTRGDIIEESFGPPQYVIWATGPKWISQGFVLGPTMGVPAGEELPFLLEMVRWRPYGDGATDWVYVEYELPESVSERKPDANNS